MSHTLRGLSLRKYYNIAPTKIQNPSSVAESNGSIFFARSRMNRSMNRSSRLLQYRTKRPMKFLSVTDINN